MPSTRRTSDRDDACQDALDRAEADTDGVDDEMDDDDAGDYQISIDDLAVIDIDSDPVNADWLRANHVYTQDDKRLFEAVTGEDFEEWLEERRKEFEARGIRATMRLMTPEEELERSFHQIVDLARDVVRSTGDYEERRDA